MLAQIIASKMKTDDIWFFRWGDLTPVEHKEAKDDKERWFHTAPKVWGIYAFPRGYIELFLIGGSFTDHHRRFLLDDAGNKIDSNDFYDKDNDFQIKREYKKLLKKRGIKQSEVGTSYNPDDEIHYVVYNLKPKKFRYTGDIWHHLGEYLHKDEIIEQVGDWVKTSYKTYLKALHKSDVSDRFNSYIESNIEDEFKSKNKKSGNPHTYPSFVEKDKYEVFIEKVK